MSGCVILDSGIAARKNGKRLPCEALQAENAKLREVANLISEYISYDRCEGCVVKTACNSHELDVCWMVTELRNQLRELGVEVDDFDATPAERYKGYDWYLRLRELGVEVDA